MANAVTGSEVRTIRTALGLSISQFANVLAVHPTTVHRWEAAGAAAVTVEGVPWNVLNALRDRVIRERAAKTATKETGDQVASALLVGGVLVALAILIAFAAKKEE